MKTVSIFERLGYPKHTDALYEVLTNAKAALSVGMLATSVGVPRMTIYRVLAALQADQLVVPEACGKRTCYRAAHPSVLAQLLKTDHDATHASIDSLVRVREKDVPSHIRFLYGSAGIRAAFDDVVAHTPRGGTVYRYTSEKDVHQVNAYLADDYRARRDAKKLERMVISNPLSKAQKRSRLERFIRCIPEDADQFDQNIIELVYGDRVALIDITHEQVTIIEHKALADFQKVIFKQLYKKLTRD